MPASSNSTEGSNQQQQQPPVQPKKQQQHPRANMLTRAYRSLPLPGGRRSTGHNAAPTVASSKFFEGAEDNPDANASASSLGRIVSALSQQTSRPQPEKTLNAFTGVFPHPAPGCSPTEPPPQHVKLTADQQKKYDAMLEHFSQPGLQFPLTLQAPANGEKRELNEWETCRLLTRESLLRYLRAAKWDLNSAKKRLTDTIVWRREYGVDSIEPEQIEAEAESGKETVLGFDKRGRPLHYMTPHLNNTQESPRQMKFAVWILERCIDMMPAGVEQLALLINFQHKSRNPTSIANAKLMLYILQNHYVERLGIALCINVPWIFKTFYAAVQPFIDPVTRDKCKFDEAIKSEVPLEQLNSDYGGHVDPTYDHAKYWPDLVRTCDRLREKQLERFRTLCDGKVGASEWVIRGGDPSKAPGTVIVQTTTNASAAGAAAGLEEAKEIRVGDEKEAARDGGGVSAEEPAASESAAADASLDGKGTAAPGPVAAVETSAAETARSAAVATGQAASSTAQAAAPLLSGLVGYAQSAAQSAVQTASAGASTAGGVVAKLAGGVAPPPSAEGGVSSSSPLAAKEEDATSPLSASTQDTAIHAENLARAAPEDDYKAILTPSADKLPDGSPLVPSSVTAAVTGSTTTVATPAPALQA